MVREISLKILLTGGTGFIGRNLKEAWQSKYDLYAPTRQELNLLDAAAVEQYLREGRFDVVVHTANTNDVVYQVNEYQVLDRNLRMFFNLKRCNGLYGKLYYFGSGAEYDMRHYIPHMPEHYFGTHIPADPYGFSKYIMSQAAGENIYDLRLFGVFGKYEEWKRRFISNMIYLNLNGKLMQMNQNMYFDYLFVDDLSRIMEWFLTHEPLHHHYNLCSGTRVDLLSLAQTVIRQSGVLGQIAVRQEGWKPEYTGDNSRLLTELGEISLTPMDTATQQLISHYREHGFPD